MVLFVNVFYQNRAAVVKVDFDSLSKDDLHRAVKNHFNLQSDIQFYDKQTSCVISDDDLVSYINQYKSSAGWTLGVLDVKIGSETIEFEDIVEEEVIASSQFAGENSTAELTSFVNLPGQQLVEENFEVFTIPYPTISCHANEEFSRNCLNPHVSSTITADKLRNFKAFDFKIVLALYQKNNCISNADKTKLSKSIVKYLLENNFNLELNRQDFIYISEIICQVFTCEITEQYYTCAINGQKPSGKLYDAYSNCRKLLCSTGLINRRTTIPRASTPTTVNISDNINADLEFIKCNDAPFEIIIQKWIASFNQRAIILADINITTSDYLALFPIFQSNNTQIFKLFLEDSKKLHPSISCIASWSNIYLKVLEKGNNLKDPSVIKWLRESVDCPESTKIAISFLVLPYFFPSTNIKSTLGKRSFKASKIEIQEKFVAYFETLEKADDSERKIAEENRGLQPRIVFFGPFNSLQAYVTLIDKKYMFSDPIEAVEQCFYLYQALNIKYPPESAAVWTFIQNYIYQVKTKFDKNNSTIKSIWHNFQSN